MNKYAVLIGNNQFPDETDKSKLPDLACPEKDVDGLAKVLASERGEFTVFSLKNESNLEVLDKLQDVVNQARKDDLLLIYYSGHGKPNKAGILHLTTVNTVANKLESRAISINRIYEILDTAKCKKIVIILDCCYSGSAGQGFKGAVDDQLQQLNNARGTYLVTASTELQVAHESAAEGLSLFTKHLIAGLETGEADKDGDGWVSMNELFDYVQNHVVAENPAQQPTRHIKDDRGSLFIIKSGRDSRKEQIKKIEHYFYELAKDKRIGRDILTEVLRIIETPIKELTAIDKAKNNLINQVFENKDTVSFIRTWDKLEVTYPIKKRNFNIKLIIIILLTIISISGSVISIFAVNKNPDIQITPVQETSTISIIEDNHKKQLKTIVAETENEKQLAIEKEKQLQLAEIKAETQKQYAFAFIEKAKNEQQVALEKQKETETKAQTDGWQTIDRYQVKDGLAKDTVTGLMWMRCSVGQIWKKGKCQGKAGVYVLKQAIEIMPLTFTYAGYKDWRLPTIKELKTLVYCSSGKPQTWNESGKSCEGDYAKPAIMSKIFSGKSISNYDWDDYDYIPYWSSSSYYQNRPVTETYEAIEVNFFNGESSYGGVKGEEAYVRYVRSGQ